MFESTVKMPITIENYKEYNRKMFIPGPDRIYLTKDQYRDACDKIGMKGLGRLTTAMPAFEWLEIVYETLQHGDPPADVGTEYHKYDQTLPQRRTFK